MQRSVMTKAKHHWHYIYAFFQSLKLCLVYHGSTDNNSCKDSKTRKSEKNNKWQLTVRAQYLQMKFNSLAFKLLKASLAFKKIKRFECWEAVWSALCQFKKLYEWKVLGIKLDKISQTNYKLHFKDSGLMFLFLH